MDALLDANVLYSIVLTDVLLELSRDRLLQPVWSEAILREAERAVAARGSVDAAAVQRRFAAMRRYFPSAMVDAVEYEPLVHQMRNHDGDRHVLAAAVAARVDVLVTCNVKHFPREALADLPVGRVATPDSVLCALHGMEPLAVEGAVARLVNRKTRPPLTISDLAEHLLRSGAPRFAALLAAPVPDSRRP